MSQYQHAEAFCHMQYIGTGRAGRIFLSIWNSRDGVTPFITFCQEYGIELQHVNFQQDRRDPDYKPMKGDLIWTSYTMEEAQQAGRKHYQSLLAEYEEVKDKPEAELTGKYSYDPRTVLKNMIDRGEDAAVSKAVHDLFEMKAPKLVLVKEDWPGAEKDPPPQRKGPGIRFA
jgi:hypothetical protein